MLPLPKRPASVGEGAEPDYVVGVAARRAGGPGGGGGPGGEEPPSGAAFSRRCDFSVLAGPRGLLREFAGRTVEGVLPGSEYVEVLPGLDEDMADGLAIAEIRHDPIDAGDALVVLRQWRESLGLGAALAVAPGFGLVPADSGDGAPPGRWRFRPESLSSLTSDDLASIGPPPVTALGAVRRRGSIDRPCIALVDSGCESADEQFLLQHTWVGTESPVDPLGHGTAVGSVIRHLLPDAWLWALRVFDDGPLARSSDVLNAICHLRNRDDWHDHPVDVVCLALTTEEDLASTEVYAQHELLQLALGDTLGRGAPSAPLVCAVGNDPARPMGFPATLTGATVAVATDRFGTPSPRNSQIPDGCLAWIVPALGGTTDEPIGWLVDSDDAEAPTRALHGSSFAAGVVSAALAGQVGTGT